MGGVLSRAISLVVILFSPLELGSKALISYLPHSMTPLSRERPKLKPPVPRFNHASSPRVAASSSGNLPTDASSSRIPRPASSSGNLPAYASLSRIPASSFENLPDIARMSTEPTEEDDGKLEAMIEKAAASEREVLSQVAKLRSTERDVTERQDKLIEELSKLDTEERELMQKVSLVQQKKKCVQSSIRSLQDEVAECRSLLERKETELNDARKQLDGFRNTYGGRLEDCIANVKRVERERQKFVHLLESEKARRAKLEEEVQVLERQVDGNKGLCQICMENKRNTVVLPCMHFLYCDNCLRTHQRDNTTCPACRGFVTALLHCKLDMD
ncbi:hypothetical protein R1flu_015530 [Riccia fluitans]|uniref:RING-type domain-containing protein n=1 Tax=Riccia fluitans TaxID=41844 RepID=A0ABD1YJ87_9MARC